MANPITLTSLNIADHVKPGIWAKNPDAGVIAKLAPQVQFLAGTTDIYTFTGTPKAELVGEGENKGSSDYTPGTATAKMLKFHLTYRFSDELKWADEDYRLGVLQNLANNILVGSSRALDLAGIHGINPATGTVSNLIPDYIMKSRTGVADLDAAAAALQAKGYTATGIAFDPVYAGELARAKESATSNVPLYPELGFGFGFDSFRGLRAGASNTISGSEEITRTTGALIPQAVMANWNAFQWGIIRNIPLELIETGDPDGQGDLKRKNQVAIRAEVALAFAIMDKDAFAVVTKTAA